MLLWYDLCKFYSSLETRGQCSIYIQNLFFATRISLSCAHCSLDLKLALEELVFDGMLTIAVYSCLDEAEAHICSADSKPHAHCALIHLVLLYSGCWSSFEIFSSHLVSRKVFPIVFCSLWRCFYLSATPRSSKCKLSRSCKSHKVAFPYCNLITKPERDWVRK